jgi:hypothetical protein
LKIKKTAEPVGERGERPGSDFLGSGVKRKRSHLHDFHRVVPGYLFRWNFQVIVYKDVLLQ